MTSLQFERALIVVVGAIVVSYAFVVSGQNARLGQALTDMSSQRKSSLLMAPGRKLGSIRGVGADGELKELLDQRAFLVVTMNTKCPAILGHLEKWISFSSRVASSKMQLVWVSSDTAPETGTFLRQHGLQGDFVADLPFAVHNDLGLGAVPQVFVVEAGIVKTVWTGPDDVRISDGVLESR